MWINVIGVPMEQADNLPSEVFGSVGADAIVLALEFFVAVESSETFRVAFKIILLGQGFAHKH